MDEDGLFDKDVSVADLKGAAETSNKGLCYVLLFNMALRPQLFHNDQMARATDTCSSPVPLNKWVDPDVAQQMASFLTWYQEDRADNLVLRTMRSSSELRCLQLVEDAVFGTMWEYVIKAHVKTGVLPSDAL